MAGWSFKKLNIDAISAPPAAWGESSISSTLWPDPFLSQYNDQLHVAYGTNNGTVWDVWFTPIWKPGQYNQQRIDKDNNPDNIWLREGPSVGVYQNQQHFCYMRAPTSELPANGIIYDSFYDGSSRQWHPQQIGNPGAIYGNTQLIPPVFEGPFLVSIWDFANQQHFTYLSTHFPGGDIIDAFYDGTGRNWQSQKINNGGNSSAPGAYSYPFGCVFTPRVAPYLPAYPVGIAGQQHIAYLAGDGAIWDVWFDGVPGHRWTPQKLNMLPPGEAAGKDNGWTSAPPAIGRPCVWVVPDDTEFHTQQHFTYQANGGEIWDAWYDFPVNQWNAQKLNVDAANAPYYTTNAPPAADRAIIGRPSAVTLWNMLAGHIVGEQHVVYRDNAGAIWDLWYDGRPQWHSRKVNMLPQGEAAGDLNGWTGTPPAFGGVSVCYYSTADPESGDVYGQLHFAWAAQQGGQTGQIWDAWYNLEVLPHYPIGGRG